MRRRPHASAPRHDVQRAGPKPAERGIERGEPGREGAEHEPVPTYFALDLAPPVGELLAERRRRGAVAPLGARSRRRRAHHEATRPATSAATEATNTAISSPRATPPRRTIAAPMPPRPSRPRGRYTQSHRLLALYDMLHRGGALRSDAAAEELGVSRRTIERDIAVLDEVLEGRVVRETTPDGGAARRLPEAERRWHVTLGQLLAVGLGARLAGFLSGKHFVTDVAPLLEQLGRSLAPGDRRRLRRLEEKIVVIGTGQKDVRRRPEVQVRLATMVEGLLLEREVEVGYLSHNRRSRGEAPRGLRVHPLALVLHRGGVYFVVDIVAGDWPTPPARVLLALDRIGAATATEVPFDPPPRFDAAEHLRDAFGIFVDGAPYDAVVQVDAPLAPYFEERFWHASQRIERRPDGSLVVQLRVAGQVEIADWVVSLGEHAEVISPAPLRELVAAKLATALARHRDRLAT